MKFYVANQKNKVFDVYLTKEEAYNGAQAFNNCRFLSISSPSEVISIQEVEIDADYLLFQLLLLGDDGLDHWKFKVFGMIHNKDSNIKFGKLIEV